jgi:predicted phosphodiesterase
VRTAILADIHGNLEALEKFESHSGTLGIDDYVFLGDAVGYGANPNECFEWVLEHARIFILGNHEKAVIDPGLRDWFNDDAREAIIWTAERLDEKYRKEIRKLPYLCVEQSSTFTHGSSDEPEKFRYLMSVYDAQPTFCALQTPLCFFGHTHIPGYMADKMRHARYLNSGVLRLKGGESYLLNPGSIGQPRDRDPRLSYGIYDHEEQTFEILRVEYDRQKAADKIRKAGLPEYLAARLL